MKKILKIILGFLWVSFLVISAGVTLLLADNSIVYSGALLTIAFLLLYFFYTKIDINDRRIAKFIMAGAWAIVLLAQIDYVPSVKIKVTDPFGDPLQGIQIYSSDYLGDYPCLLCFDGGGRGPIIRPDPNVYTTDSSGEIQTNSRIYFTANHYENEIFDINRGGDSAAARVGIPISITGANKKYSAKEIRPTQAFLGGNYEVTLSPLGVDFSLCERISDVSKKSECSKYNIIYSAIFEKNPDLCNNYDIVNFTSESSYFLRADENGFGYALLDFPKDKNSMKVICSASAVEKARIDTSNNKYYEIQKDGTDKEVDPNAPYKTARDHGGLLCPRRVADVINDTMITSKVSYSPIALIEEMFCRSL